MDTLNVAENALPPIKGAVPESLMEQFRPLLEQRGVPREHYERMVLFVEEQLAENDPFIAIVDGDQRMLGFVEDVLAQENEVLGEVLHELLDESPADGERDLSNESTWRS